MAINIEKWAYGQRLKAPLQPVLTCLAWHADKMGIAWPSQQTIAKETGYSARTVRGALAHLEELGMIQALAYPKGGHGRSTTYRLCIENAAGDAAMNPEADAALDNNNAAKSAKNAASHANNAAGDAREPTEPPRTSMERNLRAKRAAEKDNEPKPEERVGRLEHVGSGPWVLNEKGEAVRVSPKRGRSA